MKFDIRYPKYGFNYTISASETDEDNEYRYTLYCHGSARQWVIDKVIHETDWGVDWYYVPGNWIFTEKVTERG